MTCIVGLVDQGHVWLGGDSAGVSGYDLTIRADPKVFKNGDYLMGFTASFRMGQLLRFKFRPPLRDPAVDLYEYMVTTFVEAVRDCLKHGGFARIDSNVERGGSFLVGCQGRLFTVDSDYQVGEPLRGYDAVGCGQSFALGALYTTSSVSPELRVRRALEVAAEFSAGVRPPFTILHLDSTATAAAGVTSASVR